MIEVDERIAFMLIGALAFLTAYFNWKVAVKPLGKTVSRAAGYIMGPILFIIGAYGFIGDTQNKAVPPKLENVKKVKQLNQYDILEQFSADTPLSSLARSDFYTVIEVWYDGEEKCRQIEKQFDGFLKKRKDVIIQRVHFGHGVPLNYVSVDNVEYVPHIQIYGPDKKLIAADVGNDPSRQLGTRYLEKWMKYERIQ